MHRPQTPRERVAAYAAAANEEWLGARGLRAQLVDTAELARIVGLPVSTLLDLAQSSPDRSAMGQISALKEYISELEAGSTLDLGAATVWLMVT